MNHGSSQSDVHNFDFLIGTWNVLNRRKTGNTLWIEQTPEEVVWEEFPAYDLIEKHLDGRAVIEHWEATLPSGERALGLSVKAVDPETQRWSIVWIDNRNVLDFRPLTGTFQGGVGEFSQVTETFDGKPMHVRFIWDNITENAARWRQAFSLDGGRHWETNWVMEFTRER